MAATYRASVAPAPPRPPQAPQAAPEAEETRFVDPAGHRVQWDGRAWYHVGDPIPGCRVIATLRGLATEEDPDLRLTWPERGAQLALEEEEPGKEPE